MSLPALHNLSPDVCATAQLDAANEYLDKPFAESAVRSLAPRRALSGQSPTVPTDLSRLPDAALDFGGRLRHEPVNGACVDRTAQCW